MKSEQVALLITSGLILIFVIVQIFAHRYDIRHGFRVLWWGKEKCNHVIRVRYPQHHMGDWQNDLKESIKFLMRQEFQFNRKDKENLSVQLKDIHEPWAEEVKKFLKLPPAPIKFSFEMEIKF